MKPTEKRTRNQRGNALVEGAVVIVPFLAMFFGLMDFSMAVFLKNTMQFAVRQGVRYAITSQVQDNGNWEKYNSDNDYEGNNGNHGHDGSVKNVVIRNAFGYFHYLTPSGTGRPCSGRSCIQIDYFDPVSLALVTGVGSNAGNNIVQVTAHDLSWTWMIPLLRSATPLKFTVSSADVMEASPTSGIPAR
jgi:hypothetical protein